MDVGFLAVLRDVEARAFFAIRRALAVFGLIMLIHCFTPAPIEPMEFFRP